MLSQCVFTLLRTFPGIETIQGIWAVFRRPQSTWGSGICPALRVAGSYSDHIHIAHLDHSTRSKMTGREFTKWTHGLDFTYYLDVTLVRW